VRPQAATPSSRGSSLDDGPLGADEIYRRLWPETARLGYLLSGSASLAEDLAQEAFIGLFAAHDVVNPRAYLRRTIANLAINGGKRSRREQTYLLSVQKPPNEGEPETDDLWPLLDRLSSKQRAVIVLRYYLDWSESEIARALHCRPGTVKSHANKALTRLRNELS
jgi:RNA polymerase sigma factor (sigma-70 family)